MQDFKSLEHRIISSYYFTMPSFFPCYTDQCSIDEQKRLYEFIKKLLELLYNNPDLLYKEFHDDYGYPNPFTIVGSNHEELMDLIRKEFRDLNLLILTLINIGKHSDLQDENLIHNEKVSAKTKLILEKCGLEVEKDRIINNGLPFFKALKWFCSLPTTDIRRFITCSFDENHDYFSEVLIPLCEKEEGAIIKIIDHLKSKGYKGVYRLNIYDKSDEYMVSFIKNINNRVDKVGLPYMGDHNHIGFSIEYRYTAKNPCFCSIRIQNMKEILNNFDKLSPKMQYYIITNNKKCDNCRYCVQTDKTNTRPKAYKLINYKDTHYALCPLYQGYYYSFRDITNEDSLSIIEFIDTVEKYCMK